MKQFIVVLFILIISTGKIFSNDLYNDFLIENAQIDSTDTVFFHFDQTIVTGNVVFVPLSFSSDDTIYSVDFSFRYNTDSATCDSIQDLASYIESSEFFYNTNDSTMRYTSFSLQPYTSDTMLANIYFNLGNSSDSSIIGLFDVKGYLNGNQCPAKIILPLTTGINENDAQLPLSVFPNPSKGIFKVKTVPGAEIHIYDSAGNLVLEELVSVNGSKEIDIINKSNGLYLIKVIQDNHFATFRILKN